MALKPLDDFDFLILDLENNIDKMDSNFIWSNASRRAYGRLVKLLEKSQYGS